jgi:hypothetical protein
VADTKRVMAAMLLVVGVLTIASACLVRDTTGANLALAPIFVGAALGFVVVRLGPSRAGRGRRWLLPWAGDPASPDRCARAPR